MLARPPLVGQAGLTAAEFGLCIRADSSTASNCEAGTVFSSLSKLSGQAASSVPLVLMVIARKYLVAGLTFGVIREK